MSLLPPRAFLPFPAKNAGNGLLVDREWPRRTGIALDCVVDWSGGSNRVDGSRLDDGWGAGLLSVAGGPAFAGLLL